MAGVSTLAVRRFFGAFSLGWSAPWWFGVSTFSFLSFLFFLASSFAAARLFFLSAVALCFGSCSLFLLLYRVPRARFVRVSCGLCFLLFALLLPCLLSPSGGA